MDFGSGKNLRQDDAKNCLKSADTSESQSGRERERDQSQQSTKLLPHSVAMVFTPTAPLGRALRRLALTTKQAGKDYYKGTGSGSMGRHTKYGGYRIDWSKVRTYVVPDLKDFALKPFVAENIDKPDKWHELSGTVTGKKYLDAWKDQGGDI
ncbi:hypothetical protein AUEXF2481DRAFT_39182 [Aureobasidium subglaciale EXF-2481]|uniref:Uncharacterized protein n=1 Tax=Aureobasidium subglaciale (strain EXF-2481) TaxID=1043005 RepID=A0A074YEC8_AURSE|nr:uncharacterized protein AUEXF2481DRAFT_39182 [Aureobasidium subglaciale EXF-2481]KAI5211020.1 hypothetical protein E4T38_01707 [Aureobasidium subglaciale]KAI5222585.1 hypothetical protein E4T40_04924 [Aureobasidium subglaciale]KAI5233151.1 hypothetical protein E4T41_01705 [Aureobasidium subglaciale]KAI5262224.1 hypothetical protein E4T46_04636 [Aureobasidium subglaciale]KEQ96095.1 hypothetical protein AUEXF2481DRAFT_39182 [Aureobasidium subglaciale EXF-2481]